MKWNEYTLHELDLKLVFLIRDELKEILGNQADEAILKSGFLNRLQENPIYVHHFDEEYWVDYIIDRYKFLTAGCTSVALKLSNEFNGKNDLINWYLEGFFG